MAEPLIFINTYPIKEGKLEDYKEATPEWFEFIETNHPRLVHFASYVNEDGTEVTTVQVHPDADSMDLQMQLIAGRVEKWQEFIEWNEMSILVCGAPSDAVLEQMRQIAGSGVLVSVKSPLGGFNHLPAL